VRLQKNQVNRCYSKAVISPSRTSPLFCQANYRGSKISPVRPTEFIDENGGGLGVW
jgi:hypothetical protein